jgi:hypothetical protein
MMRALFDNGEIIRRAEDFPHLGELDRQQPPEKRTDADICKIIAAPADLAFSRAVVAELRMIERLLHEPGETDRAPVPDRLANEVGQSLIAREHRYVYR